MARAPSPRRAVPVVDGRRDADAAAEARPGSCGAEEAGTNQEGGTSSCRAGSGRARRSARPGDGACRAPFPPPPWDRRRPTRSKKAAQAKPAEAAVAAAKAAEAKRPPSARRRADAATPAGIDDDAPLAAAVTAAAAQRPSSRRRAAPGPGLRQATGQGRRAGQDGLPTRADQRRARRRQLARARSARSRRRGRDRRLVRGLPPGPDPGRRRSAGSRATRSPSRPPRRHRRSAGPRCDPRECALPVGVDRPTRLVEVHGQRRVVGWDRRSLARLAVDLGIDDARRDRRRPAAGGRCACRSSCGTCRRGSPTTRSARSRRGGRGSRRSDPASSSVRKAARSGSDTCVPPWAAAGSQTSRSVGATLRSPPRTSAPSVPCAPPASSSPTQRARRSNQASLPT